MEMADKRKKIEEISNEVDELHPLLDTIIPKLPKVRSHEYTHGQFERGADFVVEIEHATTRRISYVGVVVKAGKIGSGRTSEIEEQIKECAEERTYKIMTRVRCSEVWVFSSGGFSERAKEKLQARIVGRSVEFFGPNDIANFVDEHYPYFWHDLPNHLGSYLQQLSERLHILDRASGLLLTPGAEGLDIDLDTYERVKKTYAKSSHGKLEIKPVGFANEVLKSKISLLEAEMGFGKSKLARRLGLSLCSADSYHKHKIVPIFSTYKQFLDQHKGNVASLVQANLGPASEVLDNEGAELLIILDGLDECSDAEDTSGKLFEDLASQIKAMSSYRLVITSRPLRSLVDKATLYGDSRIFGIRPLSLAKIVNYIERACSQTNLPARLFEDLKRSPLFRQLPHSPIAAALFSNLLAQSHQEVPQSLTELYAKSTELMLGRWEQRKELATEKQFKTAQILAELLATYFVENRLVYVAEVEIDQMIEDYLAKRNIGIDASAICSLLFERSNLFSVDTEMGTVAFRHRSFAEFLCAQRKARDKSLSVREVALDPYWTNIFYFYAGILSDCPDVLTELRKLNAMDEIQEWMKMLSVPNYLLAAYQTEFDEVESNVMVVLLETARLFLKVRAGNTKTRLTELSEMQLLYLFKGVVVENFGYEFFNRGFDSLVLRIDESLDEQEVKAYATFFLGCAALECKNEQPFKFLIEKFGAKSLPLAVSFGIQCELESKTNLDKSSLLRFHKDKLRKTLSKGSKAKDGEKLSNRTRINDLFERPLAARKTGLQLNK